MNAPQTGFSISLISHLLLCLCCSALRPFLHTIAISLSSNRAITSGEVTIFPKEFNWDAYVKVFSDHSMLYSLGYTIILTIVTTVLCMVFTIAAAYPLTKKN